MTNKIINSKKIDISKVSYSYKYFSTFSDVLGCKILELDNERKYTEIVNKIIKPISHLALEKEYLFPLLCYYKKLNYNGFKEKFSEAVNQNILTKEQEEILSK